MSRPAGPGRGHRVKQGNGAGHGGPAKGAGHGYGQGPGMGDGWGGPAGGGQPLGAAWRTRRNPDNLPPEEYRLMQRSREDRIAKATDFIETIMDDGQQRAETRLTAASMLLNRLEGLPIARNLNAETNERFVIYGEPEADNMDEWTSQNHPPGHA